MCFLEIRSERGPAKSPETADMNIMTLESGRLMSSHAGEESKVAHETTRPWTIALRDPKLRENWLITVTAPILPVSTLSDVRRST